jgi:hypothetical protein
MLLGFNTGVHVATDFLDLAARVYERSARVFAGSIVQPEASHFLVASRIRRINRLV